MVYLWIFLGLVIAILLMGVANIVLHHVRKKKDNKKGE